MPYTRKSTTILPFRNLAVHPHHHRAATCTIWTLLQTPPPTNPLFLLPQRNHLLRAAVALAAAEATRVPVHPRAAVHHHRVHPRKDRPKPILLRCPSAGAFLLRYQIEAPGLRRCRRDPTSKMCLYVVIIAKPSWKEHYIKQRILLPVESSVEEVIITEKTQLFARAETLNTH